MSELTRFEKVPGDGVQVLILFKSDPSTNVMLRFWRIKDDDPITTLISCVVSKCISSPSALAKARPAGPPPTMTTSFSTT